MNAFFENKFWVYVFVVLAILSIIGISFAVVNLEQKSDLCALNGGTLIETVKGYSCVKVEKIDLKKAQEK